MAKSKNQKRNSGNSLPNFKSKSTNRKAKQSAAVSPSLPPVPQIDPSEIDPQPVIDAMDFVDSVLQETEDTLVAGLQQPIVDAAMLQAELANTVQQTAIDATTQAAGLNNALAANFSSRMLGEIASAVESANPGFAISASAQSILPPSYPTNGQSQFQEQQPPQFPSSIDLDPVESQAQQLGVGIGVQPPDSAKVAFGTIQQMIDYVNNACANFKRCSADEIRAMLGGKPRDLATMVVGNREGYLLQYNPDNPACGGPSIGVNFIPGIGELRCCLVDLSLCPQVPPPVQPPQQPPRPPQQPPSQQPPATPPAPCPPSTCPPVVKFPDCFKLCDDGKEKECKPKKYKMYKSAETGVCYVIGEDSEPESDDDTVLAEGTPDEFNWEELAEQCRKQKKDEQPGQKPELPQPKFIPAMLGDCPFLLPAPVIADPNADDWIKRMFGRALEVDEKPRGAIVKAIDDAISFVFDKLGRLFSGGAQAVMKFAANSAGGLPCDDPKFRQLVLSKAVYDFFNKMAGFSTPQSDLLFTYNMGNLCPVGLPSAAETVAAWLSNVIDDQTRDCWLRANNVRPDAQQAIVQTNKTRLGVGELITAWRREIISFNALEGALRELGFIDKGFRDVLRELTVEIPPVSDLLRMMVRDVENDNVVRTFCLDDQFDQNWKGTLAKWGKFQGITEETARYYWRAHWQTMPRSTLEEMYHRLRHAHIDPRVQTGEEEIIAAMKQDDIPEYWIKRLLAISFKPLTRVDVRRMYDTGAITQTEVFQSYQDQGYSDANAATMTNWTVRERTRKLRNHSVAKMYGRSEITRNVAETMLIGEGYDPNAIAQSLDWNDLVADANSRKKCIAATRKRFMLGELSVNEVNESLRDYGLDVKQAQRLSSQFVCEFRSKSKLATSQQLCEWASLGMIELEDFQRRLMMLGWSIDDARRIMSSCGMKFMEKQRRLIEKQGRDATQQQRRAETDRKSTRKVEVKLLELSHNLSSLRPIPVHEAATLLRATFDNAIAMTSLEPENILAALELAMTMLTEDDTMTPTEAFDDAINAARNIEIE